MKQKCHNDCSLVVEGLINCGLYTASAFDSDECESMSRSSDVSYNQQQEWI